jgi:hypothetical protein
VIKEQLTIIAGNADTPGNNHVIHEGNKLTGWNVFIIL